MRTSLAAVVAAVATALLWALGGGASASDPPPEPSSDAGDAVAESPLARLDRVRSSVTLSGDPAAVDALANDVRSFPPGRVRIEAQMFVADAWLGRMRRVPDAIVMLGAVRDDPEVDPLTARLAEREIVDTLEDEGRLDDAAIEARSHANRLDPRVVKQTRRLVRRRTIRNVAIAAIVAFAALGGAALARAGLRGTLGPAVRALRGITPAAAGFAAYVACAGGILASRYESGNSAPFVLFGLAILPLILLARAWAAVGSTRAVARIGRASLCAASVLAAAFVLLEAVNPTYLEGFGL